MNAQARSFLIISAVFSVTTCLEVDDSQNIVTTFRKRDLIRHVEDLKDDDQVSLNLVRKQKVTDALPPKGDDHSAPAAQPMSKNAHEHVLQHPYTTKMKTSFANQSEVQPTLPLAEFLSNATRVLEDSKADLKLATKLKQGRRSAFAKVRVKQLLDKGPEYVLSYVVIIFAVGALILSFLSSYGTLTLQYLHYATAVTGFAGALALEGFNTESPKVDRMRKNIPTLPAPEWPRIPFSAKSDPSANSTVVVAGRSVSNSRRNHRTSTIPDGSSNPEIVAKAVSKGEEMKAKMAMLKAALGSV
mmetsp:Transcript_42145/g.80626  ORF Transcript_42145/g.80626 Transcript_42145/m.80626 type:complete len:301 (-) Transcript_42145:316-1218(-)|eukprot:CAMPEP_0114228410 /NCGR_PEP_ID=MMETSP0058-20121206/2326_1 /TAXON_ID=36894 /ORGANISM="Pyramimonas parkeae, CCMP726" /LENGTH=300 /DNA_ID=CAMNT_0001339351 /DNA_START=151 /DNA_END=1053 /DNA_ORIENTATION=+